MLPTDSELEILQVLWSRGPKTVREVNEQLNKEREVGYTTTLKIMQIMLDKGFLSREVSERAHVYQATAPEDRTKGELLQDFVSATFRGDTASLVMRALGEGITTADELSEIKKLIADLEQQHKN